ncbi:hypothetical protein PMIN06_007553 [Paraphaeosphaeria minitans]
MESRISQQDDQSLGIETSNNAPDTTTPKSLSHQINKSNQIKPNPRAAASPATIFNTKHPQSPPRSSRHTGTFNPAPCTSNTHPPNALPPPSRPIACSEKHFLSLMLLPLLPRLYLLI